MAESENDGIEIKEEAFVEDFEDIRVSKLFKTKIKKKIQIGVNEVVASHNPNFVPD